MRVGRTFIFSDLSGFTNYIERYGDGAGTQLLSQFRAIARAVGREDWEVRMENLVRPDQMPYVNVTNKHFDSGDYPASLTRALAMIDAPAVRARQRAPRADGRLIGLGVATYTEQAAHGTSVFAATGLVLGFMTGLTWLVQLQQRRKP